MLGKLKPHSTAGVTGNHGLQEVDTAKEIWMEETKIYRNFKGKGQHLVGLLLVPEVFVTCEDHRGIIDDLYHKGEFVKEDILNIGLRDGLGTGSLDVTREPHIQELCFQISDDEYIHALYIREGWVEYKGVID